MTSKEQQQRLGFKKEGVVKDSHGSAAMSHEGNVESGSPVSRMQAQQPVSPGDLGFGKEGVVKDTPASAMMSHEGDVSASSPVAELQSKGATGK